MGIELAMLGLQVRHPNHYATLPRAILKEKFSYIKTLMIIKLTYSSIAIINTLGPVGPRALIAILPLK